MIAASELKMTNGEFVFIGFEYDIHAAWNRQSLSFKWIVPDVYSLDHSKCNAALFNLFHYVFEEVNSPVRINASSRKL